MVGQEYKDPIPERARSNRPEVGQMAACARQSAKDVLRERIAALRREAIRLEALAGALPEQLPPEADAALWDLLLGKR